MLIYILKSSACLAVFLMFYKLLLEKERMHTFKRYYLLAALVLALAIPSITFIEYVEVPPAVTPATIAPVETFSSDTLMPLRDMPLREETAVPTILKIPVDYWYVALWTVYLTGVLLLGLKFLVNLWKIVRNIRNHPQLRIGSIVNVLLNDFVVPHTFFNFIFLNRKKFEADEIPREVLLHEATHARQKHSLDVLFVELLQIVFWFNPLIHLAKRAIKLNHEFLADEAVLRQGASTPDYQNKLLAFASSAEYKKYQPSMANAINYSSYSSIKKRFTVMKTRTSKKSILIRSMLLLPLLALLTFGFSDTVIVPVHTSKSEEQVFNPFQEEATPQEVSRYNALAKQYNAQPKTIRVIPAEDLKSLEGIYGKMSEEQKTNAQPFPECPDPKSSDQEGATSKQIEEYNALARKYNEMLAEGGNIRIKKSDVDRLEYLFGIMSEDQRAEAEPFPDFPEPPEPPTPPTPPDHGEIEVEESVQVEVRELENVEEEVEENVQVEIEEREVQTTEAEVNENAVQKIVENQEIYDHLEKTRYSKPEERPRRTIPFSNLDVEEETKIYFEGKEITYAEMKQMEKEGVITSMNVIKKPNGSSIIQLNETSFGAPAPPSPPAPKSPLELLEELKDENVKIIVDGQEIGYAKAEKLFKDSTFSTVNVKKQGKRTVMELTTDK